MKMTSEDFVIALKGQKAEGKQTDRDPSGVSRHP
jgi:hypothetical protein